MARSKYTEEQKAAVVARASEIGITAAAKEAGIDRSTVSRWSKAAEQAQAEVRVAEKAEGAVEKIEEAVAEVSEEAAVEMPEEEKENASSESCEAESKCTGASIETKVGDAVAAIEIEAKKVFGKAKRAVQDTTVKIRKQAEKTVKKARAVKVEMIFESSDGQQITVESIAEKIPKGVDTVYIKIDENKIYWVKGEETGSVDIW